MDIYESRQHSPRLISPERWEVKPWRPKKRDKRTNRPVENTEVWKVDDDRNLFAPPANCQDCCLALAGKRRMAGGVASFLVMAGRCAKLWDRPDIVEIDVVFGNLIWWHKYIMSKCFVIEILLFSCLIASVPLHEFYLAVNENQSGNSTYKNYLILMYFVFWWHDARCSCTWDFWDWSIHWAFLSSWIYVVYLRKSHRWTHLVFFWGARKLYLLTLCRHSDQVLKESWMAKLATCIYDDCVDFWILDVWFSTFSTLTCHINNKKQCGRWPWVVSCCPPWHWFIVGPTQKMSPFWGVDSIPPVVLGEFVCCNCFRPGHQSHGPGSGVPRILLKKAPTSQSQAQHVLFFFETFGYRNSSCS